jgi:hypothetical protein
MFNFLEDIYNFGFMDGVHGKTLKNCKFEAVSDSVIKVKYKKEEIFLYVFKLTGSVNKSIVVKDVKIDGIEFECGFFEYSYKYRPDCHGVVSRLDENGFLVEEIVRRVESLDKDFFQYNRCFYIASKVALERNVVVDFIKEMKLRAKVLDRDEIEFLVDHWLKAESLTAKGRGIVKDGRTYLKLIFSGSECDAFVNLSAIKSPVEFFSICKIRNKITENKNNVVCKKHVLIDISDMTDSSNGVEYLIEQLKEIHRGCEFDIDSSSSFMDGVPGSTLLFFIPAFRHVAFHDERLEKINIDKLEVAVKCVSDSDDFLEIGTDGSGRAFDLHSAGSPVVWRNLHAGRCMLLQEAHKELCSGKKVIIRDYENFTDYTVFGMFGRCVDYRSKGYKKEVIVESHRIFVVDWNENINELKEKLGGDVFVFGCGLPHDISVNEYKDRGMIDRLHIRVTSASKDDGVVSCEVLGLGEGRFIDRNSGGVIVLNIKIGVGEVEAPLSKTFAKVGNANPSDIDIILSKVAEGQNLMTMIDRQLADVFG